MNITELLAAVYNLVRDPLEYIFIVLKYKKLPTCLTKHIIISYLMPNHKIIYGNFLRKVPLSLSDMYNKYIHISTTIRKSYYKIYNFYDTDDEVNNLRFELPNYIFSRKFIVNFLNIIPLKMQFRYRLTDNLEIPSFPLHLQKKFNHLCANNFSKINLIISTKNKIHKHTEKLKKYKDRLYGLNHF